MAGSEIRHLVCMLFFCLDDIIADHSVYRPIERVSAAYPVERSLRRKLGFHNAFDRHPARISKGKSKGKGGPRTKGNKRSKESKKKDQKDATKVGEGQADVSKKSKKQGCKGKGKHKSKRGKRSKCEMDPSHAPKCHEQTLVTSTVRKFSPQPTRLATNGPTRTSISISSALPLVLPTLPPPVIPTVVPTVPPTPPLAAPTRVSPHESVAPMPDKRQPTLGPFPGTTSGPTGTGSTLEPATPPDAVTPTSLPSLSNSITKMPSSGLPIPDPPATDAASWLGFMTSEPTASSDTDAPTERPAPMTTFRPVTNVPTPVGIASTNQPTTTAPSTAPPTPGLVTTVPTRTPVSRVSVSVTPFRILYDLGSDAVSTEEDLLVASELTLRYLERYIASIYELGPFTELADFTGVTLGWSVDPAIEIDYLVDLVFSGASESVPLPEDVDDLIAGAFSQPTVKTLLTALQALNPRNPISTTTQVTYTANESVASGVASPIGLPSQAKMVASNNTVKRESSTATASASVKKKNRLVVALASLIAISFLLLIGLVALACWRRRKRQWRAHWCDHRLRADRMPHNSNVMSFMDQDPDSAYSEYNIIISAYE